MPHPSEPIWQVNDRFLELRSRWFTLIGEHLQDHRGQILEYWRVEKDDSVIILPISNHQILLPPPSYRPGLGQVTLDLPGGRVPSGTDPREAALTTLTRELGVKSGSIADLTPLNNEGWPVNSSFSNQKLHAFTARIPVLETPLESVILKYSSDPAGVRDLLRDLTCLQCRAVLLEWWLGRD